MGWQVDDHETFDRIVKRVTDRGIPIAEGTPRRRRARRGAALALRRPKGITQEIFTTPVRTARPCT